jgi:hypothetical protein
MNDPIWKMPVTVSELVRGPDFKELPRRKCEILFSIEGDRGEEKW